MLVIYIGIRFLFAIYALLLTRLAREGSLLAAVFLRKANIRYRR